MQIVLLKINRTLSESSVRIVSSLLSDFVLHRIPIFSYWFKLANVYIDAKFIQHIITMIKNFINKFQECCMKLATYRFSRWIHFTSFMSLLFTIGLSADEPARDDFSQEIEQLLTRMSLGEKLGQMSQAHMGGELTESFKEQIRQGRWGSFLNAGTQQDRMDAQRIAVEEGPLGIPLIFGRDVIHGYRTIFPIPLAQSCSWNPDLIEEASRIAALEASGDGYHWTFAPMIDITRDPRWGRIAETCGEDPYLTGQLGAAMIRGLQGKSLSDPNTIAACAKHYAGYGAAEGGRDYNTTWIPEVLLRNVFLPPFRAACESGVATFMSAFNEINGVPASGNPYTLRTILRDEWAFDGFVVSDWKSMTEMLNHGFCTDTSDVAVKSLQAGVDMEMVSTAYYDRLQSAVKSGDIDIALIDEAVRNILRIKFRLGLFQNPYRELVPESKALDPKHMDTARELAIQSAVLLKNNQILPISKSMHKIAVIGPLADAPWDQLGMWTVDGRVEDSVTPLQALKTYAGDSNRILYAPGLQTSRTMNRDGFQQAIRIAEEADVLLLFLGEEQILSGEARCRAFLSLPGLQEELVDTLAGLGKPVVAVILAGRPLTFQPVAEKADAVLYAWHQGTMAGPALADLIFGEVSPSGKLTVTFPRTVGQIPIYYNHKNTGRPPLPHQLGIPMGTPMNPTGFTSKYLDVDHTPEYVFGYGLSYTTFSYANLRLSRREIHMNENLVLTADITNSGDMEADEIVQLYIRDLAAGNTRPVRELKGFKRVGLKPGETATVTFTLNRDDLAFYHPELGFIAEPGEFTVWIGPNSKEGLFSRFTLIE